jgi:dTDP-4-dehydrorhamnose 3,5-epimerase
MNYKKQPWNYAEIDFLSNFDKDVPVFSPSVYREFRGEIFTTYHSNEHPVNNFLPKGCNVHSRFSKSYKNVLRGLHYDDKTYKLVQSLVGDIYLVILDLRENSNTYGKWESYIITERTRNQILVPPGFANGHFALTDCIFHYTLFYQGDYVDETQQKVVKYNDSRFNISWPSDTPMLQQRDK